MFAKALGILGNSKFKLIIFNKNLQRRHIKANTKIERVNLLESRYFNSIVLVMTVLTILFLIEVMNDLHVQMHKGDHIKIKYFHKTRLELSGYNLLV